jgi:hypothetical protein
MCPWCWLSPACPCRRGGDPPGLMLGKALAAVAGRMRRPPSPRASTASSPNRHGPTDPGWQHEQRDGVALIERLSAP